MSELAADMPISRPAVSRHLRLLKEAKLVTEQAEGTRRIYRLQEQGLDAVREYLDCLWGDASVRFSLLASNSPGERLLCSVPVSDSSNRKGTTLQLQ